MYITKLLKKMYELINVGGAVLKQIGISYTHIPLIKFQLRHNCK